MTFLNRVVLTVVLCSMTSHAMLSKTFTVKVNSTGGQLCAVDKPSTVIAMAVSTMSGQCGMMCNVDPFCELFQFKEDLAQCELFDYSPSNFSAIDHCTAYKAPRAVLIACENSMLNIKCIGDYRIVIEQANFGRLSSSICCNSQQINYCTFTKCRATASIRIMMQMCEGLSSCSVTASQSVFGQPCDRIIKYLEVRYYCSG